MRVALPNTLRRFRANMYTQAHPAFLLATGSATATARYEGWIYALIHGLLTWAIMLLLLATVVTIFQRRTHKR